MKPNVIPQLTGGLDVPLLSIRKARIAVWRLLLDDLLLIPTVCQDNHAGEGSGRLPLRLLRRIKDACGWGHKEYPSATSPTLVAKSAAPSKVQWFSGF